jgi:hypothetical protein
MNYYPIFKRSIFITGLLLGFTNFLSAQFSSGNVIDNTATGITEITSADLNDDNQEDIIVSQKFLVNNKISYYLNTGNGTFGAQQTAVAGINWAISVAAGDLNGDGNNDLVYISQFDNYLGWVENTGSGFSANQTIAPLYFGMKVKVADIDNDLDNDVIAIGDTALMVFENDATGNFTSHHVPQGTNTEYYDLFLSDLNNDGFKDIVVGGISTLVYMNDNGLFSFDTLRSNSITNSGLVFLVALDDLNQDNSPDLVICGNSSSDLRWYSNDGNGFFSLQEIFESSATQLNSMDTHDLDNDGDNDLVTAHHQTGQVVWYSNDGTSNFSAAELIHQGNIAQASQVHLSQLNADSCTDLVWSQELTVHLNETCNLNTQTRSPEQNINVTYFQNQSMLQIVCDENADLKIYSLDGKLIFQQSNLSEGVNQIQVTHLPSFFVVNVEIGNSSYVQRFSDASFR